MKMYVIKDKETREFVSAQPYEPNLPGNLYWEIEENFEWPKPELTEEQEKQRIKERRNQLLAASDWTQMPDTLDEQKTKEWASYRAELRTIDERFSKFDEVVWPQKPQK